jgi:hypothetical protein
MAIAADILVDTATQAAVGRAPKCVHKHTVCSDWTRLPWPLIPLAICHLGGSASDRVGVLDSSAFPLDVIHVLPFVMLRSALAWSSIAKQIGVS